MSALVAAVFMHAPAWTLFIPAALAGATWGAPGALVDSRWSTILHKPGQLPTAYALESAVDEFVYIVGPVLSTVLGTSLGTAIAGPAIDAIGARGGLFTMSGTGWAMVVLMLIGLPALRKSEAQPTPPLPLD